MAVKDFLMGLPNRVAPEAIVDKSTCFHFDLSGEEPCQVTVKIENGKCEAIEGFVGAAKCVVKAKSEDLIGISKGTLNPMMALFTGKLKLSNQGEMLKYAKVFGFM
jgi:putative sterol carrier protein